MLPMIGVPTTAGTGSDAQSYALISDAETRQNGLRRPAGRVQGRAARPAPDRDRAAGFNRGHGIRRHLTRGRKLRHEKTQSCFPNARAQAWRLLEANFEGS